jgi:putative aldouronate transport system substrate-binding protein
MEAGNYRMGAIVIRSKRIISFILLCFMTILMSCSKETFYANSVMKPPEIIKRGTGIINLPVTEEKITLTVFAALDSNHYGVIDDFNENEFFQELERRTGVHLKFISPPLEKEQEVYNEMIASGEFADIYTHDGNVYPDGWDAAVDDDIYLDLTPYLNTYLKDYNKARLSNPILEKGTTTAAGRVVCIYVFYTEPQPPWMGLQVRKDWLDDLGLEVPVTFDDWEKMLTLFKTEKNAYAPLSIGQHGFMSISHALSAGFNAMETLMNVDGTVVYGPITDGWKEYLRLLNKWYRNGLIDPDFMINGAWQVDKQMVINGETGAWNAMYTLISEYERAGNGIKVIPVASPVVRKGDKLHIRREDSFIGHPVTISKRCKYPDVAMQIINYLYTEEGALLSNYGIENDTFVYDSSGKPVVTDKIRNNPKYSMPQAQALYLMPPSKFGGLYDWTRELSAVPEKDLAAFDIWGTADDDYILPETLNFEGGEAIERASILSAVTTYMNDCTVRFIVGDMKIERDWDMYVQAIKEMGIDRAIEITQKALDLQNQ